MTTSSLHLQTAATADTITLFWDEPDALLDTTGSAGYTPRSDAPHADDSAFSSIFYTVSLNGAPALTTQKTHATLSGLAPATSYAVEVRCVAGANAVGDPACAAATDAGASSAPTGSTCTGAADTVSAAHAAFSPAAPATTLAAASASVTTRTARRRIDVTKPPYRAVGDGATLNTAALQAAFDAASDGDCVYLPAGTFLTGALHVHSGTELYLDEGAVLQGTENLADYLPYIHSRFEGIEQDCYQSLLNLGELDHTGGYNCHDVLIHGRGTIAGGGAELAKAIIRTERERLSDYLRSLGDKIKECEHKDTIPGRMRGRLINMSNCQNVRITGLTLANGASWNVHFIYSDGIVTDHCTFKSEGVWNGDGWDPDSSTNCTIFACKFFTEDDSVAIKSGKNPQGNEINRPTEHIRVFDCRCYHGHGITIGSEISGGINDIRIWDCDMSASMQGIEIKATKKRGAYVRGVCVHNCTMSRLQMHAVGYNDDGGAAPTPPVFADCAFRAVTVTGRMLDHERLWHDCAAIDIRGFDVPGYEARNIVLDGVVLEKPTAAQEAHAVALSRAAADVAGAAPAIDAHIAALAKNVANAFPAADADAAPACDRTSVQTVTLACCKGVTLRNVCVR